LFLLWLNFGGKMRGRADLAGLVVLAIVYVPLPMVLTGLGATRFLPAVSPVAVTGLADLIWPAVEVIAMWFLLLLHWRQATRIEIVESREEPTITPPPSQP